MSRERRKHSPAFKAKVALEAIKSEQTVADGAAVIFDHGNGNNNGKESKSSDALVARLYQQISQLKVERDFLEERSGP